MHHLLLSGVLRYPDEKIEQFSSLGFDVHRFPDEKKEFDFDPSLIEAVVCSQLLSYSDLSAFHNLKFIQIVSAGFDTFPIDRIKARGIPIANAKGVFSVPIAEWVILKILELYKQTRFFEKSFYQRKWQKAHNILELTGKRAAIFGTGSIGLETAKRLSAFDVELVGVNSSATAAPYFHETYSSADWDKFLPACDIVICTLPLNPRTHKYFDGPKFKAMKQGALFLNISRGGVVDENSLIAHIESGKFRGVALDVFETEPLPPDSPLWSFENVLITPHNSFASELTAERLFRIVYDNLQAFLNGTAYTNLI